MLNSIKKYLKKVREEASKEYAIHGPEPELPESQKDEARKNAPLPKRPKAWTGVDLDGTLAYWDAESSIEAVGEPVPAMLALVKKMINNGIRVKIFTARAQDPEQIPLIREWLAANDLPELEITNVKDYYMQRLYDDRGIQVEKNTGRLIVDH